MSTDDEVCYEWRGDVDNHDLNDLHAEAFGHPPLDSDWKGRLANHSLGWVCARRGAKLLGFVNVIWDGGEHAFLLDTVVAPLARHQGIGTQLVQRAVDATRTAGCTWLHVDFKSDLTGFYLDSCGFRITAAGLMSLSGRS